MRLLIAVTLVLALFINQSATAQEGPMNKRQFNTEISKLMDAAIRSPDPEIRTAHWVLYVLRATVQYGETKRFYEKAVRPFAMSEANKVLDEQGLELIIGPKGPEIREKNSPKLFVR